MKSSVVLLLLFFLLFSLGAVAQQKLLTGRVTSEEDGAALSGVKVQLIGSDNSVQTDADGFYQINAPANASLLFSLPAYKEITRQADGGAALDVILTPSEPVAIGYATAEKDALATAVSSLHFSDFNPGFAASPEQLVQGRLGGVQLSSRSGEVGTGLDFIVRGYASLMGNKPLFVLDGVPLSDYEVSPAGENLGLGTSAARNPLNFINPHDIQRVDVLKDAAATSIYGTRGANGVVMISTKGGSGKKHQLNYASAAGLASMSRRYDLLDRNQYIRAIRESGGDADLLDHRADTDWQDEISRTAILQDHDLSYAHSYKTGNLRSSLNYSNQQGVIQNTALERITGRLNLQQALIKDKLLLNAHLTYARLNDKAAPVNDNTSFESDLLSAAYIANPSRPASANEQFDWGAVNPLALLKYAQDETATNRSLANLSLEYKALKELSFFINTGFDYAQSSRKAALLPDFYYPGIYQNGRAYVADLDVSSDLLETWANYKKRFGASSFSADVGYAYQRFRRGGAHLQGYGFSGSDFGAVIHQLESSANIIRAKINRPYQQFGYDADDLFFITYAPDAEFITIDNPPPTAVRAATHEYFDETDELQSFFGRFSYALKDKYFLTATLRADGSTRFGANNKYGYFPAAALAWRISEEAFIPDAFEDLKLRLGYGISGSHELPHNAHRRSSGYRGMGIDYTGQINQPTLGVTGVDNANLKWAQSSHLNLGVDFSLTGGRFGGSIDLYRKVNTDVYGQVPVVQPSPQPFVGQNLEAEFINTGLEVVLNYTAFANSTLGLQFSLIGAYNYNEVQNLDVSLETGSLNGAGLSGTYVQKIADGYPLFSYYMLEFEGFDEDGFGRYNGMPQLLDKSALPKYNAGFSASMRYKNWDASTLLYGQFGHYIYHATANALFAKGALMNGRNITEEALLSNESPQNAAIPSTRFLEKGDFLRMQNLELGYSFAPGLKFLRVIRLSAVAQNLFVLTSYSGLDPEVNINRPLSGTPSLGVDDTAYPKARIFSLAARASF